MTKRNKQATEQRDSIPGGETGRDPSWAGPASSTYGRVPTAPLPEGATPPSTKAARPKVKPTRVPVRPDAA